MPRTSPGRVSRVSTSNRGLQRSTVIVLFACLARLVLTPVRWFFATGAGLSRRERSERVSATHSVISRLEEGGDAKNRIDIQARG